MKLNLQLGRDREAGTIKAPYLLMLVGGVHVMAIGAFLMISGCSTRQPLMDPPPAPVMPPAAEKESTSFPVAPRPKFQPPVAVEPAPMSIKDIAGETYTVQKGDSLSKIAARYGVSVREISDLNGIKNPNQIRIGQKILLPGHAQKVAKKAAEAKKPVTPVQGDVYVVQAGDSLSKIAARTGTSVKEIKAANQLSGDMIRIGQKLIIPGGGAPAAAPKAEPAVVPAPKPVVTTEVLDEPVAGQAATAAVEDGQPATVTQGEVPDNIPFPYVVKEGQTVDDIAKDFGVLKSDIIEMNSLSEEDELTPGMKLKIPWN